eukprot:102930-Chlamydomonas_euryale.AAC.9
MQGAGGRMMSAGVVIGMRAYAWLQCNVPRAPSNLLPRPPCWQMIDIKEVRPIQPPGSFSG